MVDKDANRGNEAVIRTTPRQEVGHKQKLQQEAEANSLAVESQPISENGHSSELTLEEAQKIQKAEEGNPIPTGVMSSLITDKLQAGTGFGKLLSDCTVLKGWSDTLLDDENLIESIKNHDSHFYNKEAITDQITATATSIFNKIPILKRRLGGLNDVSAIINVIQVVFVHNAIQKAIEDDPSINRAKNQNAAAHQKTQSNDNILKAWQDFELLNTYVFRRYRMKEDNLGKSGNLAQYTPQADQRFVREMLEYFFNPKEALKQCQIMGNNGQYTLRSDLTELYHINANETPEARSEENDNETPEAGSEENDNETPEARSEENDNKTPEAGFEENNEKTILVKLNEASVIELFKKTVESSWRTDSVEEKLPQTKTWSMWKLLRGVESGIGFIKKVSNLQQYGNNWQRRLIQEIKKNDSLTPREKGSQILALTRVMKDAPNTSKIRSTKYYTHDELVSKQIQALENAQTYLEQRLDALNTELDNNNSTACASIIDSMVSVAEKIDQTTKTIGEEMHQNYSAWQTLFPKDSSSTEANEVNKIIEELLIDIEPIKSQRTYNICLKTLKKLKKTVTSDPTPKQAVHAKILAIALRKQVAQAEKKGILRKFLDWLKQLIGQKKVLTAETLLEAEPRSRRSVMRTYKESKINTHFEAIQGHLSNTHTHHAKIQASNVEVDNKASLDPSQEKSNDPALSSQEKTSNQTSTSTKKR